jgi:3,4-dihydroxy 2-butanone 4-phosphate synthase / GTP cyclohydrolase II
MVSNNRSPLGTNFTAVDRGGEGRDHRHLGGRPRAHGAGRDPRRRRPADIVQPGHIFPLMAQNGGVLVRAGHTEAGCDLARLAGLDARGGDLRDPQGRRRDGAAAGPDPFAAKHGLKIGTIADLIHYRSEPPSRW